MPVLLPAQNQSTPSQNSRLVPAISVAPRIAAPIDNSVLAKKTGNTHPLALPRFDRGSAPATLPLDRMILVLQRSLEQETELRQLLDQQQDPASPNYHQWLTPEEFGRRFGPADADIAAISNWLASQGFQVTRVGAGRTAIEFSGNAGQVKSAFHTEIHRFVVNGEQHWANASDPLVPAALAPVVGGVLSLHNFQKKPLLLQIGNFRRDPDSGGYTPEYTVSGSKGISYAIGPSDFATIYNVQPLWNSSPSIGGSGQKIAVVGETNLNIQDVRDFRTLFGLPANDPQIIINGTDPGIVPNEEVEADLDLQWSGAVAPNAAILFVTSQSTTSTQGVDLSALYIVDNNLAPVMSESYGACEQDLGTTENQLHEQLWEQAAAQGITVMVSAGDSGSAGCDDPNTETTAVSGLGVNGLGSTPFNVSMGGTDFNQASDPTEYWNLENGTGLASAKSYIPEMTWNNSCGQQDNCVNPSPASLLNIWAGSGGPSTIYSKPGWQSGAGVPQDGKRDTPDLALFAAANSVSNSFYVVCSANHGSDCLATPPTILAVGGTSVAAPAFAGVMALVNQYSVANGRGAGQGNANYTLYALAARAGASCTSSSSEASSCIFNDVVTGSNSVACSAKTNCGSSLVMVDGDNPAWETTAGYDLASGLGSVNVANLVTQWQNASFSPTTTTITSVTPLSLTHGQTVTVTIKVAPSSGSGTPTGTVALIGNLSGGQTISFGNFALNGGMVTAQTTALVGGTYGLSAQYSGDGTYAASVSSTTPVTVTPEMSKTWVGLDTFNISGQQTGSYVTTAPYGSPYTLLMSVTNSSGSTTQPCASPACPTGTIAFTDNGSSLGTLALNSQGSIEDTAIQLPTGINIIAANYSGDSSFSPSSASATVTITPASTTVTQPQVLGTANIIAGQQAQLTATVNTFSSGVAPSGTVTLYANGTQLLGSVTLAGNNGSSAGYASAQALVPVTFPSSGSYQVTAIYSGDSNYSSSSSASTPSSVTVYSSGPDFSIGAPTSLNIASPGGSGSATVSLDALNTFAGNVSVTCAVQSTVANSPTCTVGPSDLTLQANAAGVATTLMIQTTAPQTVVARKASGALWASLGIIFGGILFAPGLGRRSATYLTLLILALSLAGGSVACGGGPSGGSSSAGSTTSSSSTGSGSGTIFVTGTPAGNYLVTVTGSALINGTPISHSATVTINVQ
jgi:hypothetical protein